MKSEIWLKGLTSMDYSPVACILLLNYVSPPPSHSPYALYECDGPNNNNSKKAAALDTFNARHLFTIK
ncbi:hypothetical protein CHUAL_009444 [Chamberlinius hualienensis]